jgi:CheY-like chemotaxis protein
MTSSATILIVDDTPWSAEVLSQVIQDIVPSAHILSASHGEEGLLTALQKHPDLIIVDLEMAGMDGYEMVRILRHEKYSSQIRIIGMASKGYNAGRADQFRMLCNEFLLKPFSLNEIREKVIDVLGHKKSTHLIESTADFVKQILKNGTL